LQTGQGQSIALSNKYKFKLELVRQNRNCERVLSFYDVKEIKEYLGFVTRNENFYFERWRICIIVLDVTSNTASNIPARRNSTGSQRDNSGSNDVPYLYGNLQDLSEMEANTCYYSAHDQVTKAITTIIEAVNISSDHIPLTLYDYEVQVLTPPPSSSTNNNTSNANTNTNNNNVSTAGTASNRPGMVSKLINSPGLFNGMG